MIASSCSWLHPSGDIGWGGVVIPAHTERYYAGFSAPAFGTDGSLCVVNGATLLRYSADGARLAAIPLPASVLESASASGWPQVVPLRGGDMLLWRQGGKLARLGRDGQVLWDVIVPQTLNGPQPFADGMLIDYYAGIEPVVSYVDDTGAIRWTQPGAWLNLFIECVDQQDRAYFIIDGELVVRDAAGTEVLRTALPIGHAGLALIGAGDGRVLFADQASILCLDLTGQTVWELPLPAGAVLLSPAFMLGQDRCAVVLDHLAASGDGGRHSLLIIDGQGQQLTRSAEYQTLWLDGADAAGVLANTQLDGAYTWTRFSADGAPLWSFRRQTEFVPAQIEPGSIVTYHAAGRITPGADGRTYCDDRSVFYALDAQGQVLWQVAGEAYSDTWVEEHVSGI